MSSNAFRESLMSMLGVLLEFGEPKQHFITLEQTPNPASTVPPNPSKQKPHLGSRSRSFPAKPCRLKDSIGVVGVDISMSWHAR